MEARHSHDTHIVEVSIEDHAGMPDQLVTRTCGDAPCGLSDGANGAKDAKERSAAMKKLWIAVVMCVVFMIVEVIGGIKANSLAIMTDAAHLLSDVAAFGLSLFSLWAASWEATPRQSYGFFRIEILGTLVSIQLIWLLTGILVYEAINRMIYDSGEVEGFLMFAVAAFGLLVNLIMALVLGHDHGHGHGGHSHDHGHGHAHGDAHGHGHGHTHSISMHHHSSQSKKEGKHHHERHVGDEHGSKHHDHKVGHDHSEHDHEHDHHKHGVHSEHHHKHDALDNDPLKTPLITDESQKSAVKSEKQRRNINVQGAYLHVLGDSIQSIGVMIGGGVIWWKPQLQIIDLICTLFFSVIVLATTVNMLRNILEVLMESTPREIDARRLEQGLCEMEDVEAIHELHIWAITVGKILLACHVKIKPDADADLVLQKVISYIQTEYNISHVTIQIER